ncbi:unnamed protein product [Mytilus coruscus]|uniref:Endonuclease/exonuclease/phosphatase domain-containing protein n=1 Tax=Mytilus coruscus TaxID=42192 RepID=A0A6J8AFG0_MYTCO|nr:unnamed protein product [Mytilus coruscus]
MYPQKQNVSFSYQINWYLSMNLHPVYLWILSLKLLVQKLLALIEFLGDSVNNLTYWDGKNTKENSKKGTRKLSPEEELFLHCFEFGGATVLTQWHFFLKFFVFSAVGLKNKILKPKSTHQNIHYDFGNTLDDTGLVQLIEYPTRKDNILDLYDHKFTKPGSTIEIMPGISDHDIVFMEFKITPSKLKANTKECADLQQGKLGNY